MTIDDHDRLWCDFWTDLYATVTAKADTYRRNHETERLLIAEQARARVVTARNCALRCAERHV